MCCTVCRAFLGDAVILNAAEAFLVLHGVLRLTVNHHRRIPSEYSILLHFLFPIGTLVRKRELELFARHQKIVTDLGLKDLQGM